MKPYNPRREGIPDKTAYYDGENYLCEETECYIDGVILEECGILPLERANETPILRCPECKKVYFGNMRRVTFAPPISKKEAQPPIPHPKPQKEFDGIILPNLQTV